jgi:hypothetical protein
LRWKAPARGTAWRGAEPHRVANAPVEARVTERHQRTLDEHEAAGGDAVEKRHGSTIAAPAHLVEMQQQIGGVLVQQVDHLGQQGVVGERLGEERRGL